MKLKDCQDSAAGYSPVAGNAAGMPSGAGSGGFGAGFGEYSQLIGKPLHSREENLVRDKDEEQRRKKAKRANQILRSVSQSAGLHAFFFDKFLVWSDYVEGKLNEEEFTQRVREEVKRKAESLAN